MNVAGPPSGSQVSTTIKVEGATIPGDYRVYSIMIKQALNRISYAEFIVLDGNASEGDFTASAGNTFVPGQKVVIEAGYDNQTKPLFQGIITAQNLRVDDHVGSALTVTCKDQAAKMTIGRHSAMFNDVKDSDVMSQLISHNGLSADVTSTTTQWPALIQNYSSDWDFLLARAEVNGMIVTTLDGKVAVFPPDKNKSPVLTIAYGDSLFRFEGDLNAETQLSSISASAWDPKEQALVQGKASNDLPGPGNLSSSTLAKVFGVSDYALQTTAPETKDELTGWAKAQMLKHEYAKIIAEVRFQGSEKAKPGAYLTLDGLGDRFNGDHLISSVEHDISDGNWFTDATLGLSSEWFLSKPDVVAPPAAGLLPGVQGIYNATVKQIDQDPDNAFRILITLPLLDPSGQGVWARLTNFYSTSGAGVFFLPEVDDEVIVSFLNQDPRYPVILGSVYSDKRKPFSTLTPNQDNSTKAIVSNKHIQMLFDDKDVVFTIVTPNKNTVVLDDKEGQITIKDENDNSIVMSSSGITIKSPTNINIQADNTVSITGKMGVTVTSDADVSVSGLNIKEEAKLNYQAKATAQASVQASATLILKGGIVMIN